MQPDHAAVRGFGQRLQRQQLLRMRQRVAPVAHVFGHLHQLDQRQVHAVTAALALLFEPGGELTTSGGRGVAEHAVGVVQIVRQALGQGQRGAADGGFEAERLAQLEQPLAQRVARRVGIAVRPQQRGQTGPRRRPFQRQPGQQRSVTRGQWQHLVRRQAELGRVAELKVHGLRSRTVRRRADASTPQRPPSHSCGGYSAVNGPSSMRVARSALL